MKVKSRVGPGSAALVAGDLVCFLVFALLGLRSHEDGVTASGLLRAAVPFQAAWLVFSYLTGLQKRDSETDDPAGVMKAWLPSWVVGLALRSLVFGRAFAPAFAIVSLLFNSGLLLVWRCLVAPRLLKGRA